MKEKTIDMELTNLLNGLVAKYINRNPDVKDIIAHAVTIGMDYQEEKIKQGIDIAFQALHMPINKPPKVTDKKLKNKKIE